MANLPSFLEANLSQKRVLVRVDLNAPFKDGKLLDASRLEAIVPTVHALIKQGAKVILLSHRGRPQGKIDPSLSLRDLTTELSKLLGQPVAFCKEAIGENAKNAISDLRSGEILLLENLRFHLGEEGNDKDFAQQLANLGDVYINDGFAVSHRSHASVLGITNYLPSYAGLLLQKEIQNLFEVFTLENQPLMAIVGGSKISTKINLLSSLVSKVQTLALGGGIANTFLLAQGHDIGHSLCEPDQVATALRILDQAKKMNCQIILPNDVQVSPDLTAPEKAHTVLVGEVKTAESIFDMGPQTTQHIKDALDRAKTVIWNGPVGLFEHKPFDQSSLNIAHYIAARTKSGNLRSLIGGGETVAVVKQAGIAKDITYISTGGGAFLEYIEGRNFPSITALIPK